MQSDGCLQGSSGEHAAPRTRLPRRAFLLATVVLAATLAITAATTYLVAYDLRRNAETDLQARTTLLARSIDLRLRTYHAALETIAQSTTLLEDFDLIRIEKEARRVGQLFGGWFVIVAGADLAEQRMNTRAAQGILQAPYPRADYPELVRAVEESLRTGRSVTTDAFYGRLADELIVSTVTLVDIPISSDAVLGFSVTLRDITGWLEAASLQPQEFASIADGTRRVIARSQDNQNFLLTGLPDWFVAFSQGRDQGVAAGPPITGGEPRLFALQRLEVAPGWTLAISQPLPAMFSAAYLSLWPAVSGIMTLLLGSGLAWLSLGRTRAEAQAATRASQLTEARAADARKSRLMAVLAHDLRTPLIAMLATLDIIRKGAEKQTQARMLHRLTSDGHGMLRLIDDVLELARLGTGEARLRPEPFSPAVLLAQVGELVRASAERHGTEVVVQADDLPVLTGDVMSLRRILMNFASNAVKATRGGRVQLSATRGAFGVGGHELTIAVTDTGHGIAPEDLPRLFRDFGMLERDGATPDGTGLGLAICRRLATAMGGEVGVESTLGAGSRFWLRVTLPQAEEVASGAEEVAIDPTGSLAGLRVLVAEDHEIIRQLTCANLTRAGMRTTEAEDGAVAIELAEAQAFDLILMDLQMPRLDGDEAVARIRKGSGPSARARIIGLTAHQPPEIAVMLSDLAFDACLRKPLDIDQLAALISGDPPPVPTMATHQTLNMDTLAQLREMAGLPMLIRTLKGFAAEIETTWTDLAALIAEGNTIGAGRVIHKLAGFGDMLGAQALCVELRKFEELIGEEDIAVLKAGLEGLHDSMNLTRAQVNHVIEEFDQKAETSY